MEIPIFFADMRRVELVARVIRSDAEWERGLSHEQYYVARLRGTERPFTGRYHDFHGDGIYRCACCGTDLFDAHTKFGSDSGLPSFTTPIAPENIRAATDRSMYMTRTEVLCARCDAHLGHVFHDGPPPAGSRYCMNSASLHFVRRNAPRD
jgi:peptide-methionine (R)-S-oxide reductase